MKEAERVDGGSARLPYSTWLHPRSQVKVLVAESMPAMEELNGVRILYWSSRMRSATRRVLDRTAAYGRTSTFHFSSTVC